MLMYNRETLKNAYIGLIRLGHDPCGFTVPYTPSAV